MARPKEEASVPRVGTSRWCCQGFRGNVHRLGKIRELHDVVRAPRFLSDAVPVREGSSVVRVLAADGGRKLATAGEAHDHLAAMCTILHELGRRLDPLISDCS